MGFIRKLVNKMANRKSYEAEIYVDADRVTTKQINDMILRGSNVIITKL